MKKKKLGLSVRIPVAMMVDEGTSLKMGESFPVVFFDGEQDTSLGCVVVTPSLNLKFFQSILSQKIGISPHQFSIYLVDRKRRGSRIPVTGKFDFAALSRDMDCFFLVVLKRSRRRKSHGGRTEAYQNRFDPPANVMLLRRGVNSVAVNGSGFPGLELSRVGYEMRLRGLQMEKERYLMNMGLDPAMGFAGLNLGTEGVNNKNVFCEECSRAKETGTDAGFHWCVYDAVISGFRSPVGPIARPNKGSG